jgi:hypothetical protein
MKYIEPSTEDCIDGLAWLLGLLQGGLGLTGYDAVAHMIEEMVSTPE